MVEKQPRLIQIGPAPDLSDFDIPTTVKRFFEEDIAAHEATPSHELLSEQQLTVLSDSIKIAEASERVREAYEALDIDLSEL